MVSVRLDKMRPERLSQLGALPYKFLTCGYCRNAQVKEGRRKQFDYSSTSTVSSVSAGASTSSSTVSSSVTPTRTLTTAVISR